MANIFTRNRYDSSNLEMYDSSVKNQNDWKMNLINAENSKLCYINGGARNGIAELKRPVNEQGFLNLGSKADIENKLQNRHLPNRSFDRNNKEYEQIETTTPGECENLMEHLNMEESRFTHPISDFREMRTDHLNFTPYLHMNPQNVVVKNEMWFEPLDRNGENTRNISKDKILTETVNKQFQTVNFVELHSGLLPARK
jgi:hypothetical protein